jgi:hypothetical protein
MKYMFLYFYIDSRYNGIVKKFKNSHTGRRLPHGNLQVIRLRMPACALQGISRIFLNDWIPPCQARGRLIVALRLHGMTKNVKCDTVSLSRMTAQRFR